MSPSFSSILYHLILLLYLNVLHLACSEHTIGPILEISHHENNVTANGVATETQYASCKITTDNLFANAHVTVTKTLKEACDPKTVEEKFQKLENNLSAGLEEIKGILYAILNKESSPDTLNVSARSIFDRKFKNSYSSQPENVTDYDGNVESVESPRQAEIRQFNNTVRELRMIDGLTKAFAYYWTIENFQEKVERWESTRSVRSSTFYIGENGYAMYLRATPRYFPDGTTFVGVGLTRGRYDSSLEWPFRFRIRLEILDQSPEQHQREDRKSKIWSPAAICNDLFWGRPIPIEDESDNPVCAGLSLSREILLAKSPWPLPFLRGDAYFQYLWKGSLTVKLTVFM